MHSINNQQTNHSRVHRSCKPTSPSDHMSHSDDANEPMDVNSFVFFVRFDCWLIGCLIVGWLTFAFRFWSWPFYNAFASWHHLHNCHGIGYLCHSPHWLSWFSWQYMLRFSSDRKKVLETWSSAWCAWYHPTWNIHFMRHVTELTNCSSVESQRAAASVSPGIQRSISGV